VDLKTRQKLRKLHALLGSSNAHERENAWRRIEAILKRHKTPWVDLPDLLRSDAPDDPPPSSAAGPAGDIGPLDLLDYILRQYVELQDHEYLAVALWALHTHLYERFLVTPRLALLSPVRGCGKTVVLSLLHELCAMPEKTDSVTPAALFRLIDQGVMTMLCDEIDNHDLANNSAFRAVVNSGHRRGGKTTRVMRGSPRSFKTFAPLALAAIGTLPLPIMQRSIVINMTRADGSLKLESFDELNAAVVLNAIYQTLYTWAQAHKAKLGVPLMPEGLRNRAADNWRPCWPLPMPVVWSGASRRANPPSSWPAATRTRIRRSPCSGTSGKSSRCVVSIAYSARP
jgi:Protein of unknown function (DUF3631)